MSLYSNEFFLGGFFSEDQCTVEERFMLVQGGPYAAALFDSQRSILKRFDQGACSCNAYAEAPLDVVSRSGSRGATSTDVGGGYNLKPRIWKEMKSCWRGKLNGDTMLSFPQITSRSKPSRLSS